MLIKINEKADSTRIVFVGVLFFFLLGKIPSEPLKGCFAA